METSMDNSAKTQYPIVLIHGLLGFDRIGPLNYFNGIKEALSDAGATVYSAQVSAANSSEARGDQLLEQIATLCRQTGAPKVNLIGHSQGALTARYAAAVAPTRVASVTSVSGPNHGSELADRLRLAFIPGQLPETVALTLTTAAGKLMDAIDGKPKHPQDALNALNALTTAGVAEFNKKFPQGLPDTWGGMGPETVNGIYYYSWSGIIKDSFFSEPMSYLDPLHSPCRIFSNFFTREADANDGMVGRFSSHLGHVIRSDYPMDHVDAINQQSSASKKKVDALRLYVEHAQRLKSKGL